MTMSFVLVPLPLPVWNDQSGPAVDPPLETAVTRQE